MSAPTVERAAWDESLIAPAEGRRPATPYALHVVTPTVADLVSAIGGWLFDRVLEGWATTVLVPEGEGLMPLRILGLGHACTTEDLPAAASPQTALVVGSASVSDDIRVRRLVTDALRSGRKNVIIWGETYLGTNGNSVEYRPSAAALAFKTQAMAATTQPHRTVQVTEAFQWAPTGLRCDNDVRAVDRDGGS